MLMSMGTGINDLGNYDQCTLTPGLKYATLSVLAGELGTHLGLCVPESCTMDDFGDLLESANKMLNGTLGDDG